MTIAIGKCNRCEAETFMSGNLTREPPAAVKRRLRQEAGFGCCICGHPIYQYHHIRPFAPQHHHDPNDMMVLCPNHHHEATIGALEEAEQRRRKFAPVNIARGFADGQLKIADRTLTVEAGGSRFIGQGYKMVVDREVLLELDADDEGHLQLSLRLYDRDDRCLLSIVQNEWKTGDPLAWDIEFGVRWLRLRRKKGDVALFLEARTYPLRIHADMWRKGQNFSIKHDVLRFNGVVKNLNFKGVDFEDALLAVDTSRQQFSILFGAQRMEGATRPSEG